MARINKLGNFDILADDTIQAIWNDSTEHTRLMMYYTYGYDAASIGGNLNDNFCQVLSPEYVYWNLGFESYEGKNNACQNCNGCNSVCHQRT